MTILLLFVTFPNREEAERVARTLLEKRLIACANMMPVESMYWWKGKVEHTDEVSAQFKSRPELKERLYREINRLHSYDVPSIESIEIEAGDKYAEWVFRETEQNK